MRDQYEFRCDSTKLWQAGGSASNHLEPVSDALEEILDRREAPLRAEIERLREAIKFEIDPECACGRCQRLRAALAPSAPEEPEA